MEYMFIHGSSLNLSREHESHQSKISQIFHSNGTVSSWLNIEKLFIKHNNIAMTADIGVSSCSVQMMWNK